MSMHGCTDFMRYASSSIAATYLIRVAFSSHMHAFQQHKNIAYRFLPPSKIAAAIDMSITADPCVFTRLFLIYRGVSEDDMGIFAGAGEKEANAFNWREVVDYSENAKEPGLFRMLETAVLEVT